MSQQAYKNVTFAIENERTMGMIGKFTRTGNRDINGNYINRDIDKYTKFINSTDIDWQNAQLSNYDEPITNTGDLLNTINDLKSDIDNLSSNISDYVDAYSKEESDEKYQPKGNYLTQHQSLEGFATENFVYNKISEIVGAAPQTLDTLGEIAAALENNATLADVSAAIETKANAEDVYTKNEIDQYNQDLESNVSNIINVLDDELHTKADSNDVYTKEEIDNAGYLTEHQDLSDYATKAEIAEAGYLTEHQDISDKANVEDVYTKDEADAKFLTETNEVDLSGYYTKEEIDNAGYLTEHQSLEDYATKEFVTDAISDVVGAAPETLDTLEEIAAALEDNATLADITEAIETKANAADVYTKTEIDEAGFLTEHQDLSTYATKEEVSAVIINIEDNYQPKGDYLTEHQSLEDYATKAEIAEAGYLTEHQDLSDYATQQFVGEKIAEVVGAAPEALDTLKEIADKLTDNDDAVAGIVSTLSEKANASEVYTTEEVDEMIDDCLSIKEAEDFYVTKEEIAEAGYLTEHQDLSDYATKAEIAEAGYLTEHQDISGKANVEDVYTKTEIDEAGYLTEHQDISNLAEIDAVNTLVDQVSSEVNTLAAQVAETYATKEEVSQQIEAVVGAAPENFDTLKEFADVMEDLKVVDVEAVPAVEGEHFTQEEIDAAQEGDEAYGKTVDDWKVEPVEAVEEQSHNMTIAEFVTNSMQAVDEKEAVAKVQAKYNALLTLLNLRETDVNNVMINEELANSSTVTFDEPVDNVVIPETTAAYVVTAPLEDNATVTLTSNKYMTLDNTSEEPVSATVQRPAEEGETGTSGTTVYLVGQYDTLTLENVSPNVKSGRDAAVVNNVVISENNTKNLTLNLDLQDGATITNNSATAVTINDKNDAEHILAIVAPNSTVTLNGGTYTTLDAEVSENTLVIKRNAHIGTLNVTKGNVRVEVARQSDIASVIDNLNIAEGYSVDYLHDDITAANISKLNTTGTHVFQEDLTKSGNLSVGLFSNDDIVWDLNGHNLTSSNTRGYGIFTLRGTAQLEINDTVGTGIVKNTANEYGFWTSTVGSKVVINGGNFEAATHVLYAQKGTIEVNGGTFKLTDEATADKDQNGNYKFLLNCHDEDYVSGDAQIIVRGGTFYGFDPSNTYGEPGGPVSYVAEGYESLETGTYTYTDGDNNEVTMKIYTVKKIMTESDGTWEYIHDEQSWNDSYQNGLLATYYAHYDAASPYKEDLWNTVEQRPANWNDIEKDGQGNPIEYEDGYHYTNCVRCWQGAINAPGAKYPWAAVAMPVPFEGYIKFTYDNGTPVYPWGDNIRTFSKGFGIASIPEELGNEFLLDAQGNTTFDPTKLQVKLLQ